MTVLGNGLLLLIIILFQICKESKKPLIPLPFGRQ
jgi:hypothetical protein